MVDDAETREEQHVHAVYNEIATHFSDTRYKPWPVVSNFLLSRPIGSIGIDVGCGNGKYLAVNPLVFLIGSDRSDALLECAHRINPQQYNLVCADGLHLPHRDNTFDFGISIAVVHHWSTRERRVAAIRQLLSKLRVGGEALIHCWALEQEGSRRGFHEGMDQDVLVPWVFNTPATTKVKKEISTTTTKSGSSSNRGPDLSNIPPRERQAYMIKWKQKQEQEKKQKLRQQEENKDKGKDKDSNVKYRYYHLYRKGELEEDCISAGGVVVKSGYERDNWYVIVAKVQKAMKQ